MFSFIGFLFIYISRNDPRQQNKELVNSIVFIISSPPKVFEALLFLFWALSITISIHNYRNTFALAFAVFISNNQVYIPNLLNWFTFLSFDCNQIVFFLIKLLFYCRCWRPSFILKLTWHKSLFLMQWNSNITFLMICSEIIRTVLDNIGCELTIIHPIIWCGIVVVQK